MINKETIYLYILERISNNEKKISKSVANTFKINQNTAHDFIKQLIEKNIIVREKRDVYKIVNKETKFNFNFPFGEETFLFYKYIKPLISGLNENVLKIWEYTFTEMVNNVIDHSKGTRLEILVQQNYLNTSIIISDNGVGIFKNIQKFFNLPSLEDAINELFKGKVTTRSENHSGEGIFFSSQIMDKFYVCSSNRIFTRTKLNDDTILPSSNKKGTLVLMNLSNWSRKNLTDIFNRYSNIEDGFYKTDIRIKDIFDSDPISRSQAKRLCSGLEKFSEIQLDFDGINLIGQGFAHELFVVFQNQHPAIKINFVNANYDVQMMISHVRN